MKKHGKIPNPTPNKIAFNHSLKRNPCENQSSERKCLFGIKVKLTLGRKKIEDDAMYRERGKRTHAKWLAEGKNIGKCPPLSSTLPETCVTADVNLVAKIWHSKSVSSFPALPLVWKFAWAFPHVEGEPSFCCFQQ